MPVAVPPVLRELLLHLRNAPLSREDRIDLEATAVRLVKPVSQTGLPLPLPTDQRARYVATALVADPADDRTTKAWGASVGVSGRTLDRLFASQTGMTFTGWRIEARVRSAMLLLAAGETATSVAHQVGYQTPSAFVRVFRQRTGTTPRSYARTCQEVAEPGIVVERERWPGRH